MSWTNYHSHTHYCDGKMSPEEYVKQAIHQGVKIYGFSSHCPVPFDNSWSIREEQLPQYLAEIDGLKLKYERKIQLYKSLEIDYIPGVISINSPVIKKSNLDYTIGSVHFVSQFENKEWWEIDSSTTRFKEGLEAIYHNDIQKAVTDYFSNTRKMVQTACPDIIGHLDKIKMHNSKEFFFDENADWYKEEVLKTLETIRQVNAIVEVNTRGMYKKYTAEPYPGKMILREIQKMAIPVTINSDCHHPSEMTKCFSETVELLLSVGIKTIRIFKDYEWTDVGFDNDGLHL